MIARVAFPSVRMRWKFFQIIVCTTIAACASLAVDARQSLQRPGAGASPRGEATGTITVYIRDERGAPLRNGVAPRINLTSSFIGNSTLPIPQTTGSGWVFTDIAVGHEYYVEVKMDGYEDGHESVSDPANEAPVLT